MNRQEAEVKYDQVVLAWQPLRGQEGASYSICLAVRASFGGCSHTFFSPARYAEPGTYCIKVDVQRCRYCAVEGDSLESIAASWGSSWLQLWGGNQLSQTDTIAPGTPLVLGPRYHVLPGTRLEHESKRARELWCCQVLV